MIIALVEDLLFDSKLRATARQVGVELDSVRTPDVLRQRLTDGVSAVIIDMNAGADPVGEIAALREQHPHLPIIAYIPHVQVERADAARDAGANEVLARSKFTAQLPEILQRLS